LRSLLISILLICSSSISYAKIGDVYYCETIKSNNIKDGEATTFKNSKFKFKRYEKKITIDGAIFGKNFDMEVDFDNGNEYFAGVFGGSIAIFLYENGTFMFTMLSSVDEEYKISNVYSDCSVFK
jgi:hypothetical protein